MPLFRYRAVDASGEPMEGTMEEESAHRVTLLLQERGAQVNLVEEVRETPRAKLHGGPGLRWEDIALLNDQILAVTKSGLPLAPSVNAMAKDLDNKRLKPVLEQLQRDLESGRTLDEALERSPRKFPTLYVSLVRAGERAGNLPTVLEMLSTYSTRVLDLQNRAAIALIYPTMVFIVALAALVNTVWYVVPEYEEVFEEFGSALPATTQFLFEVSRFLRAHSEASLAVLLLLGIAGVGTIILSRRDERIYAFLHRIREVVPVIGRTFRNLSLARFSKALAMLFEAGVPVEESLDLASAASGNEYLRHNVHKASVHITQGDKIADAFADTAYFPHSYAWFLANGESRGELPETLNEMSHTYEREVSVRDEAMLRLLMPGTVVCLGLIVAFIVFALYLPLFSLGDAISG